MRYFNAALSFSFQRGRALWIILSLWFLITCILLRYSQPGHVQAQTEVNWTAPTILSPPMLDETGTPGTFSYSELLADEWGRLHAFWSAKVEGGEQDVLFYAYWDGFNWSTPLDIIYTPGQTIWLPQAVQTSQKRVHVFWTDNALQGAIWSSQAPSFELESAKAWSVPRKVADGKGSSFAVATSSEDIHIIYCNAAQDSIEHISSKDGQVWTSAVRVDLLSEITDISCGVNFAIDGKDRLHVIWYQKDIPSQVLYYANSQDSGQSWSSPLEIDRKDDIRYWEAYGPTRANITINGTDQIHVIWYGAPAGQRWHQWSADGGETWSLPTQIDPVIRGITSPSALTVDSLGRLHLATTTVEGGPFYTYWDRGRWFPFVRLDDSMSQHVSMAVVNGNTLYSVWNGTGNLENYFSILHSQAPLIPAQVLSTPSSPPPTQVAPIITTTASPENQSTVVSTPSRSTDFPRDTPMVIRDSAGLETLLISLSPVLLALAVIILAKWNKLSP